MVLRRDDWLDVARKVNWTPRYVDERKLFPEEVSGHPWLTQDAWRGWNEAYRTTYREYVANQREKDAAVPAMEYLTPLHARTRSFKEFMTEWVTEQFMKNLAEFDLEKPWFWDLFVEELDYAHHSFQLGLYTYRTTLWFDIAMPDAAERGWLNAKYPGWEATYGPLWDRLEARWEAGGEANTLSYGLPALCNLCQLPALFVRPGRNTACTLEMDGRAYLFCSQPCRWIFSRKVAGSPTTRASSIASWSGRPRKAHGSSRMDGPRAVTGSRLHRELC